MAEHENIRQLISIYIDGEASQNEKVTVERHLALCDDCRRYYNDLKKISSSLHSVSDEDLSPDLEQQINKKFREGREMKTNISRNLFQAATLGILLLACLLSVQVYIKRGIQGRLRSASDDIGAQYSVSNMNVRTVTTVASSTGDQAQLGWQDVASTQGVTKEKQVGQYEPYYLESEYSVTRDEMAGRTSGGDGYQSSQYDPSMWGSGTGFPDGTIRRELETGGYQQSAYDASPWAPPAPRAGVVDLALRTDKIAVRGVTIEEKEGILDYGSKGELRQDLDIFWDEEIRPEQPNTEQYDRIYENEFLKVTENPLSTFSIDVDTASYSNVRRFLNNYQRPPADAVRIEEMINYFVYDYPQPAGNDPFSINVEASVCPWNANHELVLIGLQGRELSPEATPPSNLVFLIDVSGSMNQPDKLPLLKNAFQMMTKQLRPQERISIVTYAGRAGLVLEGAYGNEKQRILDAISRMQAGGSTAGGQGIRLAYEVARRNFIPNGNNRVILATDGDFNVGVSSDSEMVRLIEEKRQEGIFLTILGFGTGNYKDAKMEKIADKGNGNYYYIDTIQEGKKVLGHELGSTLFTIAKDVKIQIEFNPGQIKAYRLIGYENRILAKEDFNDDTKDAGELGAGHTVTALYEIVPAGSYEEYSDVDELKYQQVRVRPSSDLLTVKLRYKQPDEGFSQLMTRVLVAEEIEHGRPSQNFRWASAVAEFGLLLRDSKYKGNAAYRHVLEEARHAKGADSWGYRHEFIGLVEKAQALR